uniref:Uncharacterized protein n=1 Tax=Aegilops tauschii subsp. strangulata TaxID=200361 RepID=A0A453KCP4_AEGTS
LLTFKETKWTFFRHIFVSEIGLPEPGCLGTSYHHRLSRIQLLEICTMSCSTHLISRSSSLLSAGGSTNLKQIRALVASQLIKS